MDFVINIYCLINIVLLNMVYEALMRENKELCCSEMSYEVWRNLPVLEVKCISVTVRM